jgi:hypothetical protein
MHLATEADTCDIFDPIINAMSTDDREAVPQLVKDVLVRLIAFFQRLPPGIVDNQRDIDERMIHGRELLQLVEVIQRIQCRIAAGLTATHLGHKSSPAESEQAEPDEEEDFGFLVRRKQGKDRKRKITHVRMVSRQEDVQLADEYFLEKGNYPRPETLQDVWDLKACAKRRIGRVYKAR